MHRDGAVQSSTYRAPLWLLKIGASAGVLIVVLIILGAGTYIPVVRTAARVPGLERDVARLTDENQQVVALAQALDDAERRYEQIASLFGASTLAEGTVPSRPMAPPITSRPPEAGDRYERGLSAPTHWPLGPSRRVGFITRGRVAEGTEEEVHLGVDVAVAVGTPVRAAGGGRVVDLGMDPEYGLFILLEHPDRIESMYGHASRLLVARGDVVEAGQVVALSGNTGRSTAPHLHFEIRRNGQPIDPMSMVKEGQ